MKARMYDGIKIIVDVQGENLKIVIPSGTIGTIMECYSEPEGYAVDIAIPDENSGTGFIYDNIILTPDQFEIVSPYSEETKK